MFRTLSVPILLCIFLSACEKPVAVDPVDPAKTAKAVAWIADRYKKQPPSGGWWRVTKIEVNGTDIDVSVLTTDAHAGMIMQMPTEAQFKLVTIAACPEITEEIWSILDPSQRVMLHVGGSGGVFIDVDCRVWRTQ